jgi:hypothetical protein
MPIFRVGDDDCSDDIKRHFKVVVGLSKGHFERLVERYLRNGWRPINNQFATLSLTHQHMKNSHLAYVLAMHRITPLTTT